MISASAATLSILVCLAQDPAPPAGNPVDLSFAPPLRRPILIQIVQEFDGLYAMRTAEARTEAPNQSRIELDLIDEITKWDDRGAEGSRSFLKAFKMAAGEIEDPPLNGLKTEFERRDALCMVDFEERRLLPKGEADALVRMVPSAALWLDLPKAARVRYNERIDLTPITSILLSNEVQKSAGSFDGLLESFDATTGIATLRGPAHLSEEGTVKGLDIQAAYECDCVLEVSTREDRIKSITISGTYIAEGGTADGRVQYEEHGRYRASVTTGLGDAVTKARQQQVRFRERLFQIPKLDVSILLPSCYSRVDDGGSQHVFQRLAKGNKLALVSIDYLEGDARSPQAYYDTLLQDLKREFGSVTTEKVSSSLGAGQAFLFSSRVDGNDLRIRSEVYPFGDRFLLLKLQADPTMLSTVMPEFAKARKTLKRVKS